MRYAGLITRTFSQISWGIVWGIIYFKVYPRGFSLSTFDYWYFELIALFAGKYEHFEPQKCPHNPEVVGSSPASATKIPLEIFGFQEVFLYIWLLCFAKSWEPILRNLWESSLTHILTHNRIVPSGQVRIFQNTMSTKSEKPRYFQNFWKEFFYDLRVFGSMFKTSPIADHRHRERFYLFISFC